MLMNFSDPKTTNITSKPLEAHTPANVPVDGDRADIPGSGDVAGIELRMLPPYIRNNQTPRFLFFPGRAKLYCLTMVISDAQNQLKGLMDLAAFSGVGDEEFLPVNKTIFYWEKDSPLSTPPNQLHVMTSIIKSKEALRETGDILTSVKADTEYQDLIGTLGSLVADTASFNLVTNISLQAASIIGRYMGKVDDRPIGTTVNSFTRLHGDWDNLGISPIHISTRNVDFSYELIVRDKERLSLENRKTILPIEDNKQLVSHEMMPM